MDYANTYTSEVMQRSDGRQSLQNGILKIGDALCAVAYAHGITYDQLCRRFPEVANNNRWEGNRYTVEDQLEFIRSNATRQPKKVLEIGGGRGEVTVFLSKLGITVTCVEPGADAHQLFTATNEKLFPHEQFDYTLLNTTLHESGVDYSEFDTILMVESLEHILAEHFDPQWQQIVQTFSGYFVVVNWLAYHPIAVGQYAPKHIHCRLVDEALYDVFCQSGKTITRQQSHLCVHVNPDAIN